MRVFCSDPPPRFLLRFYCVFTRFFLPSQVLARHVGQFEEGALSLFEKNDRWLSTRTFGDISFFWQENCPRNSVNLSIWKSLPSATIRLEVRSASVLLLALLLAFKMCRSYRPCPKRTRELDQPYNALPSWQQGPACSERRTDWLRRPHDLQ